MRTFRGQTRRPGGIQKRILAITISCLSGMCVIISCVSYYIFQRYLQHSLIQSTEINLKLLSNEINDSLSNIDRMVRFCQTNTNIATYIAGSPDPGSVLSVATYDRLSEEFNANPSSGFITRLAVVTDAHFLQIVSAAYSSTADLAEEIPKLPYFDLLLKDSGYNLSTGFIRDPFYKKGKNVLPVIRPIPYRFNSDWGGYLFIEIADDLFIRAFDRYPVAEDSRVYLTIEGHHYLYGEESLTEAAPDYTLTGQLAEAAMIDGVLINRISDSDGSKIMVSVPLSLPGCYISQNISPLELQTQQRLLWYILGGTLIAVLGLGALLMYTLNRMINIPVTKIREKMIRVAEGNFDRDPSIEWNHEIGDIGRGVNDLCENVLLLMRSGVEAEKQKKDLEYKMLQSQVNPHFLYNTLNSIKWMASMQGATGICEMTTALAKLLKSISKGTGLLIPIREELSLLQDYFTIQNYRYGGTVTMDIRVDSEHIFDCSILKFTLQPLVENSIFHGIEPKGMGHITIHAYSRAPENGDEEICIEVTDDGVGMSQEKVSRLLDSDNESGSDFFREIGVSNVQKRLQYEFGARYGITADSVEGKFTTISIHIPAVRNTAEKEQTTEQPGIPESREGNGHV